jgi:hypothetical protein
MLRHVATYHNMSLIIANSAKYYLERKGLIPTWRGPGFTLDLDANKVASEPVVPPYPKPPLQANLPGYNPPADDSPTQVWQAVDIQ